MFFVATAFASSFPTLHAPNIAPVERSEVLVESVAVAGIFIDRASADLTTRVRGKVRLSEAFQLTLSGGHRYAYDQDFRRVSIDEHRPAFNVALGVAVYRGERTRVGLHVGVGTNPVAALTFWWLSKNERFAFDISLPAAMRVNYFPGQTWRSLKRQPIPDFDLTRTLPEAGFTVRADKAGHQQFRFAFYGGLPLVSYLVEPGDHFTLRLSVGTLGFANIAHAGFGWTF